MSQHNTKPASSPASAAAPALLLALPAPGLAVCGPRPLGGPIGTAKSKAARAMADALARSIVADAFLRTGPTAVGSQIGLSRAVVRGWAEEGGLALTLRDILAGPRSFARDTLEGALLVVDGEIPTTLDGLQDLAIKLACTAAELLRLAGESKGDAITRRLILALIDRVEEIARQIRRTVLGALKGQG